MKFSSFPVWIFILFFGPAIGLAQTQEPLSLTVEESIDLALKNNETVLIARNDVASAGSQIQEAWADALPQVTFNGLYTRNFKQPVFFFPDPRTGEQTAFRIGSKNSYFMQITLEQPVFQAGKVTGGIKVARLFRKFSGQQLRSVTDDISLAVKQAYYTVQLDEQLLDINQQSLDQQYAHLVNTRKLFEQGQVSEFDTLTAWVDYTNLQPRVIRVENDLVIAQNRLKELIGLEPDKEIVLENELSFEQADGMTTLDVYAQALLERPELKQLEFQAAMLRHNIGITRSNLLPKLFFSASYENTAQSDEFNLGTGFKNSLSGTLRLEVPIFNGLRDFARVQQAKIDYRNAEYQLQQFKDDLRIALKTILSDIQEAEKRATVQQQAIKQAERALFMAERRYTEGVGTQLEIGDALLALNVTRTNYIQAIYDHVIARAELENAIGRQ